MAVTTNLNALLKKATTQASKASKDPNLQVLTQRLFEEAVAEDLAALETDELVELAKSSLEFIKERKPGRPIIHLSNPVGNSGHGLGASLTSWQPLQSTFELRTQQMFAFEFFAYSPIPEWNGAKLRVPIEDDAILMEDGVQFLHPANYRLLVIR